MYKRIYIGFGFFVLAVLILIGVSIAAEIYHIPKAWAVLSVPVAAIGFLIKHLSLLHK